MSYNGLASGGRQAIIWTKHGLVYWRLCTSLGLDVSRYKWVPEDDKIRWYEKYLQLTIARITSMEHESLTKIYLTHDGEMNFQEN